VPKLSQEQNRSEGAQTASMQVWWHGMGCGYDHNEEVEEREEGLLRIAVFLICALSGPVFRSD
jgi:hypothetical protein